jgi:hypothetical protein
MGTPGRVTGFLLGLAVVFAVALAAGSRWGPTVPAPVGHEDDLTLTISRDGRPVTDLQPHLGAFGHLVALRDGDLAYLHVYPQEDTAGPEIRFTAEVPSAGRYRLFLDFRHAGRVRTATFDVTAGRR